MRKPIFAVFSFATSTFATDLPTKKYLNLATIKVMVAAAEAEAKTRGVEVTIVVVDDSGNLLFLEKADGASLNTIQFAQKKSASRGCLWRTVERRRGLCKEGQLRWFGVSRLFPESGWAAHQAGRAILGDITAASGAKSEIDEAIAQAGIDAAFKK